MPRKRRGGGASAQVPPVVEQARKLRKAMSYPEVLLWQRLRGSPLGVKFRRQHPVGPYVLDFYCRAAALAIEVDGEIHAQPDQIEHDQERSRYLEEHGLRIVRVAASEVLRDADEIANAVVAFAATPLHHPRESEDGPPPRAGEDR